MLRLIPYIKVEVDKLVQRLSHVDTFKAVLSASLALSFLDFVNICLRIDNINRQELSSTLIGSMSYLLY